MSLSGSLLPPQREMLEEAKEAGGLLAFAGCGVGKTLVSFLLGEVWQSQRVLLLVPANLVQKTLSDIDIYSEYFSFTPPTVISYEKLSHRSGLQVLKEVNPDAVVCDEAHYLKSLDSARTRRLGAYLEQTPGVRCAFLSGSMMLYISNVAHLAYWALRSASPLPRNPRDVLVWDEVIFGEANKYQYAEFRRQVQSDAPPRVIVQDRLRFTSGVFLDSGETVGVSLNFVKRRVSPPSEVQKVIDQVFAEGCMADALTAAGVTGSTEDILASQHLWDGEGAGKVVTQAYCGFIYYWEWGPEGADEGWLRSRAGWGRAVRSILAKQIPGIDTPAIVRDKREHFPQIQPYWEAWDKHRHKLPPPTRGVWVSDYAVDDIKEWYAVQTEAPIIWVGFKALGEKLSEDLKIPYYRGEMPTTPGEPCVMSIASMGTGKNLQAWANNFIAHAFSCPMQWEQLIARTHRRGQTKDTYIHHWAHGPFGAAMWRARKKAKVIQATTRQRQRLLYGSYL